MVIFEKSVQLNSKFSPGDMFESPSQIDKYLMKNLKYFVMKEIEVFQITFK
jgi:hypothetical protein